MRLPRSRLRALLLAVAAVAVVLWAGLMARRRARYLALAEQHAAERALLEAAASLGADHPDAVRRWADHHRRLWDKYRRAAARPWRPVAPDPPEPD